MRHCISTSDDEKIQATGENKKCVMEKSAVGLGSVVYTSLSDHTFLPTLNTLVSFNKGGC